LWVEAVLIDPPQDVEVGLLKLADMERHAAIVAGLGQGLP
jgi:hypothetical protein